MKSVALISDISFLVFPPMLQDSCKPLSAYHCFIIFIRQKARALLLAQGLSPCVEGIHQTLRALQYLTSW